MSTIGRSDNPSILIVADVAQPPFSDAVAAFTRSSKALAVAADVYAATAELALSPGLRHVLIDVRSLDPQERAFLQIAPRYFRGVRFCVADLPGASTRLRLDENTLPLKTVQSFVAAILTQPQDLSSEIVPQTRPLPASASIASPPPAPPSAVPPLRAAPRKPLSTDGVPSDGDGPSLHEAVRRRMASEEPAPPQRKPPVRIPPKAAPTISPQELDALLAPDENVIPPSNPGDGNTGRPR
ncbi:MAG TPA: hypothetical protein VJZ71_18780 [Phycisphaerae bacterium]|nr:hypothetical protein [Phycisphaerae bacterium]